MKGLTRMMMPNWSLLPFRPRVMGVYIACALGFLGITPVRKMYSSIPMFWMSKTAKILTWANSRVAVTSCRAII